MQSLVFLTYFVQKLIKKSLWGARLHPLPPGLKFRTDIPFLSYGLNQKTKITPYAKSQLNLSKNEEQWRLSTCLVFATSKWRLWRHSFELNTTSSIFLNFTRFLSILYQVSASSDLNQKKIWLPWQQWMTYPQTFNFKRGPIRGVFLSYLAKPLGGGGGILYPSPNRVKIFIYLRKRVILIVFVYAIWKL